MRPSGSQQKTRLEAVLAFLGGYRGRMAILLAIWLLATAFGYVWCRVQTVKLGYRISAELQRHAVLLDYNKKLQLELASLRQPERVEAIARQQLGLSPPQENQVLVLP